MLLGIVYISYRQTIAAYPGGGGSYTVARENLGQFAGVLAAAALMIDYILTVAVGISAGVGALVSAVPSLERHMLVLCLGVLVLITMVNLRGLRETGAVFMAPTFLFVGTLLLAIAIGVDQDSRQRRISHSRRGAAASFRRRAPPSGRGCCSRRSPAAVPP